MQDHDSSPPENMAPPYVAATIARLRAFNPGQSLAGLSWQTLRDDGRP